jgi:hypothetical protein
MGAWSDLKAALSLFPRRRQFWPDVRALRKYFHVVAEKSNSSSRCKLVRLIQSHLVLGIRLEKSPSHQLAQRITAGWDPAREGRSGGI